MTLDLDALEAAVAKMTKGPWKPNEVYPRKIEDIYGMVALRNNAAELIRSARLGIVLLESMGLNSNALADDIIRGAETVLVEYQEVCASRSALIVEVERLRAELEQVTAQWERACARYRGLAAAVDRSVGPTVEQERDAALAEVERLKSECLCRRKFELPKREPFISPQLLEITDQDGDE